MAYKKRTLRRMTPTARKVARLIGDLASTTTKLKHQLAEIEELERSALAMRTHSCRATIEGVKAAEAELFKEKE